MWLKLLSSSGSSSDNDDDKKKNKNNTVICNNYVVLDIWNNDILSYCLHTANFYYVMHAKCGTSQCPSNAHMMWTRMTRFGHGNTSGRDIRDQPSPMLIITEIYWKLTRKIMETSSGVVNYRKVPISRENLQKTTDIYWKLLKTYWSLSKT